MSSSAAMVAKNLADNYDLTTTDGCSGYIRHLVAQLRVEDKGWGLMKKDPDYSIDSILYLAPGMPTADWYDVISFSGSERAKITWKFIGTKASNLWFFRAEDEIKVVKPQEQIGQLMSLVETLIDESQRQQGILIRIVDNNSLLMEANKRQLEQIDKLSGQINDLRARQDRPYALNGLLGKRLLTPQEA